MKLCSFGLLTFALVFVGPCDLTAKDVDNQCAPKTGNQAVVAAVNERLELVLADGRVLRLVGLEAPEPTPTDPELAAKASDWLSSWITNQPIVLDLLATQPDRWGRYAAMVFRGPSSPATKNISVAERLVEQGFARVMPDQHQIACEARLLQAEKAAREANLGLWKDPYYAIIATDDRAAFAEHAASFILAEGRVTAVRDISGRQEIFFGPKRRSSLAVTILQRNVKIFEAAGLHFHDLIGQTLRVRGLLETRFGPEIELSQPSEVERLGNGLDETAKPVQKAPEMIDP